ncbi:Uncharacterized protein FWK35_00025954 [Aphis craccivora]|uniref:Uncharacterized protein n=1 Tax=Aphis craccivora TaxID=307492 RepID=A0A6G0Y6Q2_APHCR|nr:Uncharacterized protein FWK35_00025954 [Aphis craccivora]
MHVFLFICYGLMEQILRSIIGCGVLLINYMHSIRLNNLHFHNHIDATCCKVLKSLGFLKRICNEFKLITPLKALYCALIR